MSHIEKRILQFISKKNVPHLLFHGPNTTLKRDAVQCFIDNIYQHPQHIKQYVFRINCIEVKGIKHIKESIKLFSMQIINTKAGIPFKTIILEHGEYLTYDSQYALRRTIEQFSHNTRFIINCENKDLLLTPILSRFVDIYVSDTQHILHVSPTTLKYSPIIPVNKKMQQHFQDDCFDLSRLHEYAKELYHKNVFAMELMDRFKDHPNFHTFQVMAPKIFSSLRNEVLSIFYVLYIFRNNQHYEIFDLY
jgi:hypothetical protein